MSNSCEYITSWKKLLKHYIKNLVNAISIISGAATFIIPILSRYISNVDVKYSYVSLFICIIYPLYLLIKELLISTDRLFNENINLNSQLKQKDINLSELENNRDTILNTYENYKNNNIPYEKICSEICIAIDVFASENRKNGAITRLKETVDTIKNNHLMKGDEYNG